MKSMCKHCWNWLKLLPIATVWAFFWFLFVIFSGVLIVMMFSGWGRELAHNYRDVSEFVGALLTPLIALLAAFITMHQLYTARLQVNVERQKDQSKIHAAVNRFVLDVSNSADGTVTPEVNNALNLAHVESHFAFDTDEVANYILDMWKKQKRLESIARQNRVPGRSAIADELDELQKYFSTQLESGVMDMFKKHRRVR